MRDALDVFCSSSPAFLFISPSCFFLLYLALIYATAPKTGVISESGHALPAPCCCGSVHCWVSWKKITAPFEKGIGGSLVCHTVGLGAKGIVWEQLRVIWVALTLPQFSSWSVVLSIMLQQLFYHCRRRSCNSIELISTLKNDPYFALRQT